MIKTLILINILFSIIIPSQTKEQDYIINKNYDSRLFLSKTQVLIFNKLYKDFNNKLELKNEWKDVDPLNIFTPDENRKRRRELFLYEFDSNSMTETEISEQKMLSSY